MDTVCGKAAVYDNSEASSGESEAAGTTGSGMPHSPGAQSEKAPALAGNVEQRKELDLQGIQRSSLGNEAESESPPLSQSIEADFGKVSLDERSGRSPSSSSENDDAKGSAGRRLAELTEEPQDPPPVPEIDVGLSPNHQTFPAGFVHSIDGKEVIVDGTVQHTPLEEGSILWITESREPLGWVDDVYGSVKNPYYVIRYNNEDEVPSIVNVGTSVSFVPEFANMIDIDYLYKRGYTASDKNEEEFPEEAVFSDDDNETDAFPTSWLQWMQESSLIHTEDPEMAASFQHTSHPTVYVTRSAIVWPNEMGIQQQPMFFPSANGMTRMQQNSLVRAGGQGMAPIFQH